MKKCIKCNVIKPINDFQVRKEGRISGDCRECHREYMRQHYNKHKTAYLEKATHHRKRAKEVTIEIIWHHLLTHPCVDCGETNPIVLDFDHRDNVDKQFNVSVMRVFRNTQVLLDEIAKCDVRCANCHRIRTAKQFNTWKYGRIYPLATNELKG